MTMTNRQLCGYELSMLHRDLQCVYSNFIIAAKYDSKPEIPILKAFLSDLCSKWTQVNLQIKENKELIPLKTITYDQLVQDLSDRHYKSTDEAVIDILDEFDSFLFPLGVESPLWKVLLYNDVLFVVCNHVLFDGTAGKMFHQYYTEFLDSSPVGIETDVMFQLEDHPNFQIDASPIDLVSQMLPPDDWTAPPAVDNRIPEFEMDLMTKPIFIHYSTNYKITQEDTVKLLQIARAHNVKLTALLYGIMSTNLMNSGVLKNGGDQLTTLIPINLRPQVHDKSRDYPFALLFSKWIAVVDIASSPKSFNDSKFWEYCQTFQSGLTEAIPTSFYPFGLGEKAFLQNKDAPEMGMKKLATVEKNLHPTHSFAMSNVGALNSEHCKNVWFDQPMVDAAFACHLIGSSEYLNLNFMAHRAIPLADYKTYVDTSITALQSFIQTL